MQSLQSDARHWPVVLLWRLWWRPDRRFVVAALGVAAALLLPIAGSLVLQGIEPSVDGPWIAYRVDGAAFRPAPDALSAVWLGDEEGIPVAAFVIGEPHVDVDEAWGADGLRGTTGDQAPPAPVPPGYTLVHPDSIEGLPPSQAHLALLSRPIEDPGLTVAPAAHGDAFETASLAELQRQTGLLVAASVPAVVAVAVLFGDQEARRLSRTAATLAAMGRPRLGERILMLRVAWLLSWGIALGVAIGYLVWRFGGPAFHPADTDKSQLGFAILIPSIIAFVAGIGWSLRRMGDGDAQLRAPRGGDDLPGHRIPWLPPLLRPLMLGTRLIPVLLVAALLFALNMGFPVAAASVPAAVAGERGEWVIGADAGISLGGQTNAAPADVMAELPEIDAIVAEILLPTLLAGEPLLVRGGDLEALANYHGLTGVGDAGLWLGDRVAERLGLRAGDVVSLQGQSRVAWIPVAGIYEGTGLLRDEAVLEGAQARVLAEVPDGQATVLRMRPDTLEARAVLGQGAAITVEGLRLEPEQPTGGELVTIHIDVVNHGAAGARELPIRVNGAVVATARADMPGHARDTITQQFVAPIGPFKVQVNPEVGSSGGAPPVQISAPLTVFGDDALIVTVRGDGSPLAGRTVTLVHDGDIVATNTTDGRGTTRLGHVDDGQHTIVVDGLRRGVLIGPEEHRHDAVLHVVATWTDPAVPQIDEPFVWHASVRNIGGGVDNLFVPFSNSGTVVDTQIIRLLPGQSGHVAIAHRVESTTDLDVAGTPLTVSPRADPTDSPMAAQAVDAQTAGALQAQVADRVLGDAQRAFVGLGTVSLASVVAIVYLATERTLEGRRHVQRTFIALGQEFDAVRHRASWEGGILAGAAFLVAVALGKILFAILALVGWPRPFAHVLPDPFGWLFVLQAGAAFAGAAALAAYVASGRTSRTP